MSVRVQCESEQDRRQQQAAASSSSRSNQQQANSRNQQQAAARSSSKQAAPGKQPHLFPHARVRSSDVDLQRSAPRAQRSRVDAVVRGTRQLLGSFRHLRLSFLGRPDAAHVVARELVDLSVGECGECGELWAATLLAPMQWEGNWGTAGTQQHSSQGRHFWLALPILLGCCSAAARLLLGCC
jgi:hypothetical protein